MFKKNLEIKNAATYFKTQVEDKISNPFKLKQKDRDGKYNS